MYARSIRIAKLAWLPLLSLALPAIALAQPAAGTYDMIAPLPGLTTGVTLTQYLNGVMKITIGLAGVLAVVMLVICGIRLMASGSVSGKGEAKTCIWNAIFGILLAIGAWILLNTINPALLGNDANLIGVPVVGAPSGNVSPTQGNSVFSVPSSTVTVNESAGSMSITFTRTDTSQEGSVNYMTRPIDAIAGVNYNATFGTITFPPGVGSVTITIPIVNDTFYNNSGSPLTFLVQLATPRGGTISGTGVMTVAIKDDENSSAVTAPSLYGPGIVPPGPASPSGLLPLLTGEPRACGGGGGSSGGGGGGSGCLSEAAVRAACAAAGFDKTEYYEWVWDTNGMYVHTGWNKYVWVPQGPIGDNGVVVVAFTPSGPADGAAGSMSMVEYPGGSAYAVGETVSISTSPCNFSLSSPWQISSGQNANMSFTVGPGPTFWGSGQPLYGPPLTPGTTYYMNIAARDANGNSTCSSDLYPADWTCDARIQLTTPSGHSGDGMGNGGAWTTSNPPKWQGGWRSNMSGPPPTFPWNMDDGTTINSLAEAELLNRCIKMTATGWDYPVQVLVESFDATDHTCLSGTSANLPPSEPFCPASSGPPPPAQWNGTCPGFDNVLRYNWNWNVTDSKVDTIDLGSGMGPNDILVVPFVPDGPADVNNLSSVSGTGYPAGQVTAQKTVAISTKPCDLNPVRPGSATSIDAVKVKYGVGTVPTSSITGQPTAVALTPGVKYYINVAWRNGISAGNPLGTQTCTAGAPFYPNCNIRLEFSKPSGHGSTSGGSTVASCTATGVPPKGSQWHENFRFIGSSLTNAMKNFNYLMDTFGSSWAYSYMIRSSNLSNDFIEAYTAQYNDANEPLVVINIFGGQGECSFYGCPLDLFIPWGVSVQAGPALRSANPQASISLPYPDDNKTGGVASCGSSSSGSTGSYCPAGTSTLPPLLEGTPRTDGSGGGSGSTSGGAAWNGTCPGYDKTLKYAVASNMAGNAVIHTYDLGHMTPNSALVVSFETPAQLPVSKSYNVSLYREGSDPFTNRRMVLSETPCDFTNGISGFLSSMSTHLGGSGNLDWQTPPGIYTDRPTLKTGTKYYLNVRSEEACDDSVSHNMCDFFLEGRFGDMFTGGGTGGEVSIPPPGPWGFDDPGIASGVLRTEFDAQNKGTAANPLAIDCALTASCASVRSTFPASYSYTNNMSWPMSNYWMITMNNDLSLDQRCELGGPADQTIPVSAPGAGAGGIAVTTVSGVKRLHLDMNQADYMSQNPCGASGILFVGAGAFQGRGNSKPIGYLNSAGTHTKFTERLEDVRNTGGMVFARARIYATANWGGVDHMIQVNLYENAGSTDQGVILNGANRWKWPYTDSIYHPGAEIYYLSPSGAGIPSLQQGVDVAYDIDWQAMFAKAGAAGAWTTPMPSGSAVPITSVAWANESVGQNRVYTTIAGITQI